MSLVGSYQRRVLRYMLKIERTGQIPRCTLGELVELDGVSADRRIRESRLGSLMGLQDKGLVRSVAVHAKGKPSRTVFELTVEGRRVAKL